MARVRERRNGVGPDLRGRHGKRGPASHSGIAVVMAALRVEDPAAVRDHYQRRLLLGFERHLVLCRDFYQSGRRGPWWDGELALLAEGIAWSAKRVNGRPFRFQLNGFELESRC